MAIVEKSPIPESRLFVAKRLIANAFDPNWHFHPEYQLFIVLKGSGTRFIGDHVSDFSVGDLVLTGPNLPHLWRSDPIYFEEKKSEATDGIVVYFTQAMFGKDLLEKSEILTIKQLLTLSARGIHFTGQTAKSIKKQLIKLTKLTGFEAYISLLKILNDLSHSSEYTILTQANYTNTIRREDKDRMNKVHAYVLKNFQKQITLAEVAKISAMTPTSFSRYFTKHANKTFSNFITEIRIAYARKLLIETDHTISQIAYLSGFQTLSNFNYQFKKTTQYNPTGYRSELKGLRSITP